MFKGKNWLEIKDQVFHTKLIPTRHAREITHVKLQRKPNLPKALFAHIHLNPQLPQKTIINQAREGNTKYLIQKVSF